MAAWLYAQSALYNFCLGAMLPIVPALSPGHAGFAFTAFSLFKLLYLVPAGWISDRIGHDRGVALTLLLQVVALVVLFARPDALWLGRVLEGMALGQGTVSSVSFLRLVTTDPGRFGKSLGKLMAFGGLGFILGPLFGYGLLPYGARVPLGLLLGLTLLFFGAQVVWLARRPPLRGAPVSESAPALVEGGAPAPDAALEGRHLGLAVVALAAAKVVGIGWQPGLAWWTTHAMHLSAALSGLTFLVMGVAFSLGAGRRPAWFARGGGVFAVAGLVGLEVALRTTNLVAWWLAVPVLGFWFGAFVTDAVGRLGWNRPDRAGRTNSAWMIAADVPMAFAPLALWQWLEPSPGVARVAVSASAVVIAVVGLAVVDVRAARGARR